ncbi:MAG: AAA family ATPase [Chloroflexota bacterium]|nr:AAA family ATPase [Chloroflexota bacterium]
MSAGPPLVLGEGERRVCTIVFCDLIGSTGLAEHLDPEEWADVVRGAFAAMVAPIARYEGTVARLLGDAVLAYFGAPIAHEDDPERAVLAALEMARAVRAYGERLPADLERSGLAVRVGVNTGLVVLQDMRAGGAFEQTAIGDVANVAARLQSLAEPGTVVVSDRTQRQIAAAFTFRPLGPVQVKGREAPVTAFIVTGRVAGSTAATASVRPAPLVGRERELAALRQALADVRAGRGRVCALIADAGLGKTRLLREAQAYWLATTPVGEVARWTEARGESFAQGQPYGVLRPQLLALLGATDDDPPDVLGAHLGEAWRDASAQERERRARATGLVLGLGDTGGPGELEGEKLREEIVAAVTDLVRARHAAGPGVLAFDDLQWSDAASADMLQRLASLCDELPLLLLLSFRPERQSAAWRLRQWLETELPYRYEEIAVAPLTDAAARTLVTHLLDGAPLGASLSDGVLRRAEGNPLFIEELVRALVEAGFASRGGVAVTRPRADMPLPDTVQALLTARIDRLDEGARRVSHAAAVIGRTFSQPVLAEVTAAPELDRHLTALERHDLVREEARRPERRYAFRHPLLQEATYASILRARRRVLHTAVARAIERQSGDRLEELSAIIGHHLAEAGDPAAIRYLI